MKPSIEETINNTVIKNDFDKALFYSNFVCTFLVFQGYTKKEATDYVIEEIKKFLK